MSTTTGPKHESVQTPQNVLCFHHLAILALSIQLLLWSDILTKNVFPEPSFGLTELIFGMFMCRNREHLIQFLECQRLCLGDKKQHKPPTDYIPPRIPVECTGNGESILK